MEPQKKYASSTDVARLANVSQSAVSRTFKGGRVSEATRQKVLEAAKALNYRPSALPQIMLTERSRLVAIIIGGMYNPFYARALEVFSRRLQDTGHQVLLFHVDSGYTFDAAIPLLAGYRVDAIVSALAVLSEEAAEQLATFNIPIVAFNTAVSGSHIASVNSDNGEAAGRIADLFIERGARRFSYISGPLDSPSNNERRMGFFNRLAQRGFTDVLCSSTGFDFTYEAGYAGACELFSRDERPDALFCANDLIALGAIDAMRCEFGIRCPGDVLVAGFDDIPPAGWKSYDLTSVMQDAGSMVDATLDIIENRNNGQIKDMSRIVEARLVERSTTDAARFRQVSNGGSPT
jgi:DNA-binding LacI/PurR family transcriptional regulator